MEMKSEGVACGQGMGMRGEEGERNWQRWTARTSEARARTQPSRRERGESALSPP